MPLTTSVSPDGRAVNINIIGPFDFSALQELTQAFKRSGQPDATYTIDMSRAETVRDSGIAILLMVCERFPDSTIKIVNSRPETTKLLRDFAAPGMFDFVRSAPPRPIPAARGLERRVS